MTHPINTAPRKVGVAYILTIARVVGIEIEGVEVGVEVGVGVTLIQEITLAMWRWRWGMSVMWWQLSLLPLAT